MNYNMLITRLYYLLVYADGTLNDKEVAMAKQMIKTESLNEEEFNVQMKMLDMKDKGVLFNESMLAMRKLNHQQQVRIIAWMCVVANSDGFMDRTEWQLIYKIYHKELGLPLHDIFSVQKELNKTIWEKTSVMGL